ncbi:MAG: hypothetical protein ACOCT7_00835 [Candidatus Saliniplasma sp.]
MKNVADQDMEEKDTVIMVKDTVEENTIAVNTDAVVLETAAAGDTTVDVHAVQATSAHADSTMGGEDSNLRERRSKSLKNTKRNWKKNFKPLRSTSKN